MHLRFFGFIFLLIISSSCGDGNNNSPSTAGCTSGAAVITVKEGALSSLCGCSEGFQTVVSGSSLSCTVSVGSVVVFEFQNRQLFQQIIPTSANEFAPSGIITPDTPQAARTHAITLNSAGSFGFQDAYNSALAGTITVQ